MPSIHRGVGRGVAGLALLIAGLLAAATPAAAQYFGRNKVQYQDFKFREMHTKHFDLFYYPPESLAVVDAGRMAERWYARHSQTMNDTFDKRSIILYADAPDFQQTNVVGGFISQGTGGVTEGLRSRVVLPFTGNYADDDHVIGHELVHVFQYDIAGKMKGGGLASMNRLPLWLIEGMAEYLSIGRDDPNTAMWLRDAAIRNDLPTIKKLSTDPRYFPYRYGEALWAYIGGRWGDEIIPQLYRSSLQLGWEGGVRRTLGITGDTLSAQWLAAIKEAYLPLVKGRTVPDSLGVRLLRPGSKYGDMDVSPSLSPDGKYVAFITSRGLLDMELYVADASTGKIVKKLTSPNSDAHFDALSFISASGSWSPDGTKFAFVVFADGVNEIDIFDVASKNIIKRIRPKGIGAINDVSWGPNGQLAFSGMHGGLSDLYLYGLETGQLVQLTNDRYSDLQPTWSPDGSTLAFVTDSGPKTSFDSLTYGPEHVALMDVATRHVRLVPLFPDAKSINPQWTPDGKGLYFVSDRDGFDDIYRVDLASGDIFEVTRSATGVSGITALSPTLSVARDNGRLVFSLFERGGYSLHRLEAADAQGTPVAATADTSQLAAVLPPSDVVDLGAVTVRVRDALRGLPGDTTAFATSAYRPSLSLEGIGSTGVGVGFGGPFGTQVGGGVTAYFTDELNNHILGAGVGGGGDVRDFGGQVFYANLAHRWNWQVAVAHSPIPYGIATVSDTTVDTPSGQIPVLLYSQQILRQYNETAQFLTQYPFSMTRRIELGAGYTYLHYGVTTYRYFVDQTGYVIGADQINSGGPPSISYGTVSAAYVGDYSYFGFTSPIAGGRYRFEVDPVFGQLNFTSVLADWRRYLFVRPITFAFRAIHVGRYGQSAEDSRLYPLYVGDPYLVRGYDVNSFNPATECPSSAGSAGACPAFDRLIGSRIAVANFEVRIPVLGTDQLGLINFPYLPTEISPFIDAGVAWTAEQAPTIEFSRTSQGRVPVFSAGVSARFNILGYLVAEVYYARPFQRPNVGGQWGFQIIPGW